MLYSSRFPPFLSSSGTTATSSITDASRAAWAETADEYAYDDDGNDGCYDDGCDDSGC